MIDGPFMKSNMDNETAALGLKKNSTNFFCSLAAGQKRDPGVAGSISTRVRKKKGNSVNVIFGKIFPPIIVFSNLAILPPTKLNKQYCPRLVSTKQHSRS